MLIAITIVLVVISMCLACVSLRYSVKIITQGSEMSYYANTPGARANRLADANKSCIANYRRKHGKACPVSHLACDDNGRPYGGYMEGVKDKGGS